VVQARNSRVSRHESVGCSGLGSSCRRAGVSRRAPSVFWAKWSGVAWSSELCGRTVPRRITLPGSLRGLAGYRRLALMRKTTIENPRTSHYPRSGLWGQVTCTQPAERMK
jgi:hypothetical protein